ncbi:NADH:ubiquinone oxidoreductase, Na(+)-translocating, C subunit [Maribacter orientalis]|uniref:NADH:ubiquinone oxidoreductase, Na(+)-translocating, C subunit n=1 Tax=Maribacter orientalis TaxID=228957 RepID=A0A1H7NTE1_9FLAO|nr:FMN-binding protein [Maribacter orientalis]SEL26594.1 NADH:ubiquinone oxidoreductase, Na(+)-translocating, C subunit [Maribacter orientalis]|tara:strand:- start:146 stop:817 length:672 start_codon:yes stop_codon:yes gene_type:complete
MKTKIIFLLVGLLFWNCKQKSGTEKSKEVEILKEQKAIVLVPPSMIELCSFADISLSNKSDINQYLDFKQIDANQSVSAIDMNSAIALYKKMMKREKATSLPIFEIKNTDNVILLIQGVGFGGPIWAKVLVNRNSLEIKNIAFEHFAETDGYGAAMTQSPFVNEFIGTKINLDKNTFALQKNMEKRIDDGVMVDGISGATMTSEAAIEMVNEGLKKYKGYLRP